MPVPPRPSPLDHTAILDDYAASCTPRSDWIIGIELERHVLSADGLPTSYSGEHGIGWLLGALAKAQGWKPVREGNKIIALSGPGGDTTLEPGSQLELSSAPRKSVRELAELADAFTSAVAELYQGTGREQVALGFTPYSTVPAIEWTPKGRYKIMREHLIARGPLAHHMMKGTCAVQSTFDYASEADCARKVRVASALGPLVTAMFANSPIAEGRDTGFASYRGHIWTQTDPARTGFPAVGNDFSFERWVDWLLDVPMMFTASGGNWKPAHGKTFREWMTDGIDGTTPTWDDWDLHLTSVFPEVRVKHFIEVRGGDAVPAPLAMAFSALFEGLFYDEQALDQALELAEAFQHSGTASTRFAECVRHGLHGSIAGTSLTAWAEQLSTIAAAGLDRAAPLDRHVLKPLEALITRGNSPAHELLAAYKNNPSAQTIIRHSRMGLTTDPLPTFP